MPPRTVPTVLDRHREVRRCTVDNDEAVLNTVQEIVDEDPANFSDDSLEDVPPPPPPPPVSLQPQNKRGSIAWEVSLESDNEALMIPGSAKVVGKRQRKSTDHSSNYLVNFRRYVVVCVMCFGTYANVVSIVRCYCGKYVVVNKCTKWKFAKLCGSNI